MRLAFVCLGAAPELRRAVLATAEILAVEHDVTAIVAADPAAEPIAAERLGVRVVVAEQAPDVAGFWSAAHRRSALALDLLREVYGVHGPDYVEFADRGGEGAVTVQARLTRDPFLATTRVVVRAWGTDEMLRVLDGWLPDDDTTRLDHQLERTSMRHADLRLVAGDPVERTYARFYPGRSALAPARVLAPGVPQTPAAGEHEEELGRPPLAGRPLRLLYAASLAPRNGAHELVEGLLGIDRPAGAWQLTICGSDGAGGLGTSMREQLELLAAGDPRIRFAADEHDLDRLLADHDLFVLPARWESWSATGVRALLANRPLLATPTGGLCELVDPGDSGWLTADASPSAIGAVVEQLLDDPGQVAAAIADRRPLSHARRLTDGDALRERYATLLAALPATRPAPQAPRRPPLVSVVIPYFRLSDFVERAVASAFAQTHPEIEVVVVDDGSDQPADAILDRLAERWPLTLLRQENQGVGAARNLGIAQSAGQYVLPLDADNELDPRFVERAVATLESEPELAFVTAWSTFVDESGSPLASDLRGYEPAGGRGPALDSRNIAGDAVALLRRRLFDLGHRYRTDLVSFEDWLLYRELSDAGHYGTVMPERLVSYRVRSTSKLRTMGLPHTQRLAGELRARQRERSIEWT